MSESGGLSVDLLSALGTVLLAGVAYLSYNAIYNLYLHPLSHFPGPPAWSASRLPFVKALITGTIVHDVEKMHRKYGPAVRIAPNEISFAHSQAWTDIFTVRSGHLPFQKDAVWWGRQPGDPETLTSAGTEDHARMRKLLHGGFTPRALKLQEPILHKYVSLLVERMSERANLDEGVFDIVPWFNYTTFDIFGDLGFGESFDCLQNSRYHPWIALLFSSVKLAGFVIAARFYPWVEKLLMKLIPKSLEKQKDDHFQQIRDKVDRRLNWELERADLMSHVIKHNGTDKESNGMTLEEIQATFAMLTTAGSETTATLLTGTTSVSLQAWALFRDPNCFHDATSFIPERWMPEAMQSDSPFANDQREAVHVFSAGPRMCMGRHLAFAELRLILARLLWEFDLEAAGELLRCDQLRTFLLWEKMPLKIRVRPRSDT